MSRRSRKSERSSAYAYPGEVAQEVKINARPRQSCPRSSNRPPEPYHWGSGLATFSIICPAKRPRNLENFRNLRSRRVTPFATSAIFPADAFWGFFRRNKQESGLRSPQTGQKHYCRSTGLSFNRRTATEWSPKLNPTKRAQRIRKIGTLIQNCREGRLVRLALCRAVRRAKRHSRWSARIVFGLLPGKTGTAREAVVLHSHHPWSRGQLKRLEIPPAAPTLVGLVSTRRIRPPRRREVTGFTTKAEFEYRGGLQRLKCSEQPVNRTETSPTRWDSLWQPAWPTEH